MLELWNWILTVCGFILGLVAFAWKVYTHRTRNRIQLSKKLAERVFKPWLRVSIFVAKDGAAEFRIPLSTPELKKGRGYLEKKHPKILELWVEAEKRLGEFEEGNRQYRGTTKKTILREMGHHYDGMAVHHQRHGDELPPQSYNLDKIWEVVGQNSYAWTLNKKIPEPSIGRLEVERGSGRQSWYLRDQSRGEHLRIDGEEPPNIEEYKKVLLHCIKDTDVVGAASEVIKLRNGLDGKVREFKNALLKVIVNIELDSV